MNILLKIYLFSVAGACMYICLIWMITVLQDKSKNMENDPMQMAYKSWDIAPWFYKTGFILIPVLNTFFSLFFISLLFAYVKYSWRILGHKIALRLSEDKNDMRYFRLKCWIMRKFFFRHYEFFIKRYEWDIIERLFKIIINEEKNEKDKPQSEHNSKPYTDGGNKETLAGREDNNPSRSTE